MRRALLVLALLAASGCTAAPAAKPVTVPAASDRYDVRQDLRSLNADLWRQFAELRGSR